MKILYFTDPHNSDTAPRMRKETYREDILAKQEALIEPAKACDMVICGGDVFHQKKPERISHKLVNQLWEIYREFPDMWIVAGNHDYNNQPEELKHNPLATLGKLPNVYLTAGSSHTLKAGICMCCLGLGDYYSFDRVKSQLKDWAESRFDRFSIAVIHGAVSPKKYPFPVLDFKEIEKYADLFLLGHIHDLQKVELHGKLIAPGALSRGVLRLDESLNRKVGYCIVDVNLGSSAITAEFVPLDVKSVDDIFKMEKKGDEVKRKAMVSSFVEYAQEFKIPKSLTKESLVKHIESLDLDAATKKEALRILEAL